MKKIFIILLLNFCFSFVAFSSSECDKLDTKDQAACKNIEKDIEDTKNSDAKCTTGLAKLFTAEGSKYSCTPNRMGLVGSLIKLDAIMIARTYLNMQDVKSGQNNVQAKVGNYDNCQEDQRSDYKENETKVTFGVCDDNLIMNMLALVPIATIIIAIVDGKNPIDVIKEAVQNESPYMVYTKKVGETGALGPLGEGEYKIELIGDKVCVSIKSVLFGYVPVGCKYTKEPCPNSKYAGFFDGDTTKNPCTFIDNKDEKNKVDIKNTQDKFGSCYVNAIKNSRTIIQITSPIANCIKANLTSILTGSTTNHDINNIEISEEKSPVFRLQRGMKKFITMLFILYIMFFGMNMALGRISASKDLIISMLKFILVVYFSVGIDYSGKNSGITEYLFPFVIEGSTYFANWVGANSVDGLCAFNGGDYDKVNLSLFDAIDCKISHYLGINDIYVVFQIGDAGQIAGQIAKLGILFVILGVCIYLGLITIVAVIIAYFVLIVLIFINFIQAFIMSLVCSTILAILAPIVVPLYLFEQTRQYFNSWLAMLMSFALQPMVISSFFVLFSGVFNYGYYGNCEFTAVKLNPNNASSSSDFVKIFLLDKDRRKDLTKEDSCSVSIGYLLSPSYNTKNIAKDQIYTKDQIKDILRKENDKEYITEKEGVFTSSKTVSGIGDVIGRLLKSIFILYICYGASSSVANFASDMTDGVNLSSALSNVSKNFSELEKGGRKFGKQRQSARNAKDRRNNISDKGKDKDEKEDKDSTSSTDKSEDGSQNKDNNEKGNNESSEGEGDKNKADSSEGKMEENSNSDSATSESSADKPINNENNK